MGDTSKVEENFSKNEVIVEIAHVGFVAYERYHAKTAQVINKFVKNYPQVQVTVLALDFQFRKQRKIIFDHRPYQFLHSDEIIKYLDPSVKFERWNGTDRVCDEIDLFFITAGRLIDIKPFNGRRVFNVHPGFIPYAKGLDAFKWSILKNIPVANTLHTLDAEIDMGEVYKIELTPFTSQTSINELAKIHYQIEIDMSANFLEYIGNKGFHPSANLTAFKRMPESLEREMLGNYENWKQCFLRSI
jgi:phosphoribosylglycinamide formyltransferase 1